MLRVEWQRFQNFGGGDLNVDLLSIGALVRFQ